MNFQTDSYYTLTGQPPFAGETLADTLSMVMSAKPVPPSRHNPEVAPELEAICLTCLAKDPKRRYRSAKELAEALEACRSDKDGVFRWSRFKRPIALSLLLLALAAAAHRVVEKVLWRNHRGTTAVSSMPEGGLELENDPNTLLLLHCNGSLNGDGGEQPESITGVTFANGKVGGGAYFSKANEVLFSKSNNLSVTAGTLEFWIKPRWNGRDGKSHGILAIGETGGFVIGKDSADNWRLIFNRYGGNGRNLEGELAFNTEWGSNEWHHMAFVWTRAVCKAYVDGRLVKEVHNRFPPPDVLVPNFRLGSDKDDAVDAVLDEIRISDRERTADEVEQSYLRANSTTPLGLVNAAHVATSCLPAPDGMIGWWPGDTDFRDLRASNHGTPLNGVSVGEGKVGAAFNFSSADAAVRIPYHEGFNFNGESQFTVAAWVRPKSSELPQAIVVKSPGSGRWDWGLYCMPDGRFMAGNDTYHGLVWSRSVFPDTWSHVAFTYNRGIWKMFHNGTQTASATGAFITQSKGAIAIGRKGDSTGAADSFMGAVDEVQIFDRVLNGE